MDDDRLLELGEAEDSAASAYTVRVTPLLERMDVSAGDGIDWSVDDRGRGDDVPMLVFGRLAAPDDENGENADERAKAAHPRDLRERDGEVYAPVPDALLEADPPNGLGLEFGALGGGTDDTDVGDGSSDAGGGEGALLFESIGTDETIGLVPVRFEDGTPYRPEPLPETTGRSDPIAEAELATDESTPDPTPRPETLDAPIDADVIEDVRRETGVSLGSLTAVLEELSRRRLVGEADAVADYPPLAIDDRGICVIEPEIWGERIAEQLETDVDRDALDVAREVHNRQAKVLLARAGPSERIEAYEDFDEEYDAIVTDERETAEWEVADPEANRGL